MVKERWQNPRPGECSEQRAFVKLVEAIRGDVDLGIADNEEAEEVWQKIRNKLTHMAMPDGGAGVIETSHSLEEVEVALRTGPKAFVKSSDGRWVCISDRLNVDIPVIEAWILRKIEESSDDSSIEAALAWVQA